MLQDASVMEELLAKAKIKINWTAEFFYHIGIMEFLHYQVELSEKRAEHFYEKMARHPDIRKEFYFYIMNNDTFPKNLITIEGFTKVAARKPRLL